MAKRKQHSCHHCGTNTQESNGGFRFCGDECEKQHDAEHCSIREQLQAEGFVQNPETPNIWSKAGVSITEGACYQRGIDDVLAKHQSVVTNPALPIKSPVKSKPWKRK
jgi:hypothetical protein